ncbi:MAG: hypothetical protein HYU64_21665 [Armatimonadetes bacterium]|nr:hypothetical protein [Armatimonadota bacterium]
MKKTTLYIEDRLLRRIKEEALRRPGANMTKIINEALKNHLEPRRKAHGAFENLKKARGTSPVYRGVSDPVAPQKKLRAEWD